MVSQGQAQVGLVAALWCCTASAPVEHATRTDLQIRRNRRIVQNRPLRFVRWADIPQLSTRDRCCPAAWQQYWQQSRRNGLDLRPSAFQAQRIGCSGDWVPAWLNAVVCPWWGLAVTVAVSRPDPASRGARPEIRDRACSARFWSAAAAARWDDGRREGPVRVRLGVHPPGLQRGPEEDQRAGPGHERRRRPDRPADTSGPRAVKLVQNGTLKTYPGFPHGMPTTHADTINNDLLAFIQS
jgi:hypothetical protein